MIEHLAPLAAPLVCAPFLPGFRHYPAPPPPALELAHIGSHFSTASSNTLTVNGASIGAAAAARTVIVAVQGFGADNDISGVTLDGNAMTQMFQYDPGGTGQHRGAFFGLAVASGTTADIVATKNGSTHLCISIWRALNLQSLTPTATATSANAQPWSTTINVPANGALLGCAILNQGGGTTTRRFSAASVVVPAGQSGRSAGGSVGTNNYTWTGLTEDADTSFGTSSTVASNQTTVIAVN